MMLDGFEREKCCAVISRCRAVEGAECCAATRARAMA